MNSQKVKVGLPRRRRRGVAGEAFAGAEPARSSSVVVDIS